MPENASQRVLPGLKPVLEFLRENPERIAKIIHKKNLRGPELAELEFLCRKQGISRAVGSEAELDALCRSSGGSHVTHQGVAAILSEALTTTMPALLESVAKAPLPLIIALDQVQDTGNIGAVSRSAWAFGCAGLILPRHNSAALGAAAYRASAGALAKLPQAIVPNLARALDEAEEAGFNIYGAAKKPDGAVAQPYFNAFTFDWALPAVLCMGGEAKGLRPNVAKRCSLFLSIPFARKFDSLNIAQACAILTALCAAQFQNNDTVL